MADEAYAALFMHDGVRAFRIMHDSASTAFPDIFQHSAWYNARRIVFFGHISERMPNLDTLVVSLRPDPELKKPLFELIRSLPRLRNVVLPGFPDPIGVFSEIQNCCHLEQVSFSVDYDLHYWHQPASIATSLASISLPAFDKLETLSLRCGFGLASLILEHLFGHDPLRLTNLAVVSESEDTPFQVHKLCGSISQVGHRLKKLCLAGLRFYRPSHDTLCFLSESVIHFEDIKPILKCSNLESFELGYPFDLPWQEIKSIALAWPRLKSGGFYLLYKVHPHDPMAVKVRNWRHVVQKAFLSPDKQISDSRMLYRCTTHSTV
ncbi:hypothetical protein BT96DRAFT_158002 [Gymnopus androsaceus JB14]|uniref:F-box domain-containing protein n=1 Tax=Gymnopus androsaceus JB14 TaxID=1447944 RepID=A0A6A4HAZ5_9AGAR|nr:hypothetical protein BT96DRAFT_158002 [Gymnopus androsaceus JB14]